MSVPTEPIVKYSGIGLQAGECGVSLLGLLNERRDGQETEVLGITANNAFLFVFMEQSSRLDQAGEDE